VSTFRIVIDRSLCSGFGSCVEQAPNVFALDASGLVEARTLESDSDAVLDAAAACPMGAIAVYEAATGKQAA
jgi:ferredoxin